MKQNVNFISNLIGKTNDNLVFTKTLQAALATSSPKFGTL